MFSSSAGLISWSHAFLSSVYGSLSHRESLQQNVFVAASRVALFEAHLEALAGKRFFKIVQIVRRFLRRYCSSSETSNFLGADPHFRLILGDA